MKVTPRCCVPLIMVTVNARALCWMAAQTLRLRTRKATPRCCAPLIMDTLHA